jgi:predicted esterase
MFSPTKQLQHSFVKKLFGGHQVPAARGRTRQTIRLEVESLEERSLLSVVTAPVAYTPGMNFQLGNYYINVPTSYDASNQTPTELFVWSHGDGGDSQFDIDNYKWTAANHTPYIEIADAGYEKSNGFPDGFNTNEADAAARIIADIADVKTHFNIDPQRVILGGYSGGGDISYRVAFLASPQIAGVLAENTTPFRDTGLTQSQALIAPFHFEVVQLAHTGDMTYPLSTVQAETSAVQAAGFPLTLITRPGTHADFMPPEVMFPAGSLGTQGDAQSILLPYLDAGWISPGILSFDPTPAAGLVFLQQPSNAGPNATLSAVKVEVVDASGVPETSDNGRPITIALGANPGGGTLSGTLTVNDVNGVATFSDLSINAVGVGYTLMASSASLSGVTSMPFNISTTSAPGAKSFVRYYATGADAGGAPLVNVYDAATGTLVKSFDGLPAGFAGGVRVAVGDVNGDGVDDIICGAGPGAAPQVTVYDGKTFQPMMSFYGLPVGFTGGVFVAAGDVNGDGFADIIVSADRGGGPQVTITSGKDGSRLASFYATAPTFTGGIRVACADINGDGFADVIAAAGPGGGPQVTLFDGKSLSLLTAFYALPSTFTGGMFVTSGDVNGDGRADILIGAEKGGGPEVNVFNGPDQHPLGAFFALTPTFTGGVRVAAAFTMGATHASILTAAGPGGGPQVSIFDGLSLLLANSFFAYPSGFTGGVFVAGN